MRYDDGRTPIAEWCECYRPELGTLLFVHEQLADGTFTTHHDIFGNHLPKSELDQLRKQHGEIRGDATISGDASDIVRVDTSVMNVSADG